MRYLFALLRAIDWVYRAGMCALNDHVWAVIRVNNPDWPGLPDLRGVDAVCLRCEQPWRDADHFIDVR